MNNVIVIVGIASCALPLMSMMLTPRPRRQRESEEQEDKIKAEMHRKARYYLAGKTARRRCNQVSPTYYAGIDR